MCDLKNAATKLLKERNIFLKTTEVILATLTFCGAVYFGAVAIGDFFARDWSDVKTMYDFITTVLTVLLGFEVARLILVHSIGVVMELMLLIIARKMLYPDLPALDLIFCAVAFAVIIGVYYIYTLKPLKSLDNLTE